MAKKVDYTIDIKALLTDNNASKKLDKLAQSLNLTTKQLNKYNNAVLKSDLNKEKVKGTRLLNRDTAFEVRRKELSGLNKLANKGLLTDEALAGIRLSKLDRLTLSTLNNEQVILNAKKQSNTLDKQNVKLEKERLRQRRLNNNIGGRFALGGAKGLGFNNLLLGGGFLSSILPFIAGAGIVGLAMKSKDAYKEKQRTEIGFQSLAGEGEGSLLFKELRKTIFDRFLPYDLALKGAEQLLSYGVSSEKVTPAIQSIGNIARGDTNRFQGLTKALGDVNTMGRLAAQELRQFVNAGFNPLNVISKQTGKSMNLLKQEMKEGKISFDMVYNSLSKYPDMIKMFQGTLIGAEVELSNSWRRLTENLGKILEPAAGTINNFFSKIVGSIADSLEQEQKKISDKDEYQRRLAIAENNSLYKEYAINKGLYGDKREVPNMIKLNEFQQSLGLIKGREIRDIEHPTKYIEQASPLLDVEDMDKKLKGLGDFLAKVTPEKTISGALEEKYLKDQILYVEKKIKEQEQLSKISPIASKSMGLMKSQLVPEEKYKDILSILKQITIDTTARKSMTTTPEEIKSIKAGGGVKNYIINIERLIGVEKAITGTSSELDDLSKRTIQVLSQAINNIKFENSWLGGY